MDRERQRFQTSLQQASRLIPSEVILYASNDWGVLKRANGSSDWVVAGTGLPMVEVAGLTIVPSARKLYAATHGRSAWLLTLP